MHRGRKCTLIVIAAVTLGAVGRQIWFNLEEPADLTLDEALKIVDPATLSLEQREVLSTLLLRRALREIESLERLQATPQLKKLLERLERHDSTHHPR